MKSLASYVCALIIVVSGLLYSPVESKADVPISERDALMAFFNSTNGLNWDSSLFWLGPEGTECTWLGVTCDPGETTVTGLELHDNNLNGPLPTDLQNLPNLEILVLSYNTLTGTIPTELGSLAHLRSLNLWHNDLVGEIPAELGNCANLEELVLRANEHTGAVPSELGNCVNLQLLNLSSNELTGTIPSELGNLTNLVQLEISGNQFAGEIPSEVGNCSNLEILNLGGNHNLSGSIPSELCNLVKLTSLKLGYNQLTGPLPDQIGNLVNLTTLTTHSNQLSGDLPSGLGNCVNLELLVMRTNQFTGTIPTELGNLVNLQNLSLQENFLTGNIPTELGNLVNLNTLDLRGNQLGGPIPSELSNLTLLSHLELYEMELSGPIPSELGNMNNLIYLVLHDNQLNGTIPSELGLLTNLIYLTLNSNAIEGEIPVELLNLINLSDDACDFRWNALYTDDDTLRAFINQKQVDGNWENTQTVVPENTSASASSDSITILWEPIGYFTDEGCYQVHFSETTGGPYNLSGATSAKNVYFLDVTGLEPVTDYYFVVNSVTYPHDNNQNTVYSELSEEIVAQTTAYQPSGTYNIRGKVLLSGSPPGSTHVTLQTDAAVPSLGLVFSLVLLVLISILLFMCSRNYKPTIILGCVIMVSSACLVYAMMLWETDTGTDGSFEFHQVVPFVLGEYLITFTHFGYESESFTFSINEESPTTIDLGTTALLTPGSQNTFMKAFGGPNSDSGNAVQQTNDGGYVTFGSTSSFGAFDTDLYLVKTDMNGDEQWHETWDGNDPVCRQEFGHSVCQTADGGYTVFGESYYCYTGWHFLLLKYDDQGALSWMRAYEGLGGLSYNVGTAMHPTADGGFIMCGSSYQNTGNYIMLIKTDSSGSEEWRKNYGGTGYEEMLSVVPTYDGGYIMTGWTERISAGEKDVYVIRTDEQGNELWSKPYGGPNDDIGTSAVSLFSGDFVLCGYTKSFGAGNSDMYLIKIDSDGNEIWSRTYGGDNDDRAYSITKAQGAGFVLAGSTNSSGSGSYDVYLVKTNSNGHALWTRTHGWYTSEQGYSISHTDDNGYIITGVSDYPTDVLLLKTNQRGNL